MALLKPSHALRVVFVGIVGTWIACADEPPVGPKPLPKAVTNADVSQASEHPTAWNIAAYTLSTAQWEDNHGTAEGTYIVDLYPSQGLPPQGWHENATEQAVSIPDIGFSIHVTEDDEDTVVDYRPFEVVAVPAIDAPWGTDAPSPGTIQVKFTPIASVLGEGTQSAQPTAVQELWNAIFGLQDQWNSLYLWGFFFDLLADPLDKDARAKALQDLRQRAEQRVTSSKVALYSAITRMEDMEDVVEFADPYLERAVRQVLRKAQGPLTTADLASLIRFKAHNGNIKSLAGLEHATALQELNLSGTGITDAGVASLSSLTNLKTLNLDGTGLTDAGVASLSSLTNLKTLNLSGTGITDAGVASLSSLTDLETLYLDSTRITDAGLASLSSLTNLKSLHLYHAGITDAGLASLSSLTKLKTLNLNRTGITDAGLASLSSLTNLETLYLDSTRITDAGVASLSSLTKLKTLILSGTGITDVSPLLSLTNLQVLHLYRVTTLSDASKNTHIPALIAKGVAVFGP